MIRHKNSPLHRPAGAGSFCAAELELFTEGTSEPQFSLPFSYWKMEAGNSMIKYPSLSPPWIGFSVQSNRAVFAGRGERVCG
jgi:hypothetical protein